MKELPKLGLRINKKKQALIITEEQENILWEKNILGSANAQQLLDTTVYLVGLNVALRAGQEHRNLRIGEHSQLMLKTSRVDGRRYLQYREDISKCVTGGLKSRKTAPKIVSAYENPTYPERCIVSLYEKYISLRPNNAKSSAFYLRPSKFSSPDKWYDDAPVGVHPLQQTVAKLCKIAGFEGFSLTIPCVLWPLLGCIWQVWMNN